MKQPNPFLQLVPNRVATALRRVREMVWHHRQPLAVRGARPTPEHRSLADARRERLKPVAVGTAWGRLFDQRWFAAQLPPAVRRHATPRYLEWRDQGEATLHVNGLPFYGFDVAHRRVALPRHARELWIEAYCCQSAIWHPEATGLSPRGCVFDGAFLVERDDAAWHAVQDLQCLVDLMLHLRSRQMPAPQVGLQRFGQQAAVDQATPPYRRLLRLLDDAIDAFDSDGVAALQPKLTAILRELRDERPIVRAALTGHAHIDLVWLWPERMGEAKAVHTFATVNRLMDLYPEFRFAYSQPASYRAVERRAPALAGLVRHRLRAGTWEATGALDVESDTLLPCGEALARSFLLGQEEFRRLCGRAARLLWLPDVFGYSACLPQLMRLAGVEWFFTTKLTWSAIHHFPYSSFVWRGFDGSEVIAHVTQNAGYNNRLDLAELDANARGHVQSDVHPEFLHPVGYGDGGGGPTEEMCERARRLDALAGTPGLRWTQPEAFFERLARLRDQLPVWNGECYLEYHRGTYTTHGDLKSAFRGLERALQIREAVACARGRRPDLTAVWRRLVFAQFHDYIPGSSVNEVYAEGIPELRRLAREQQSLAESELSGSAGETHAFNPLPLTWRGWVRPPRGRKPVWLELPPLASAVLNASPHTPSPVVARARTLDNGIARAEIDARGRLRRLRVDDRELALTAPAAQLVLYADRPAAFESWDIDRAALSLGRPVTTPVSVKLETARPDLAVLAVTRRLGRASTIVLRYVLVAGEPILRIEAAIDWREQHSLLKLHFPTSYRGRLARFGAPFGSVTREQLSGSTATEAQWEVPGSRWATIAHDGERDGLALITEAKYGFLARDAELTVSLLRAPRTTGCDEHRYIAPPELRRHPPPSVFTDQGRHNIRLAVGAFNLIGPRERQPAALADTLFVSPLLYRGAAHSAGLLGVDGAPTLVPAWAVPLGRQAWLLRLHEVGGQTGQAKVRLAPGFVARSCGLDGSVSRTTKASRSFSFGPHQIVSVRIERA